MNQRKKTLSWSVSTDRRQQPGTKTLINADSLAGTVQAPHPSLTSPTTHTYTYTHTPPVSKHGRLVRRQSAILSSVPHQQTSVLPAAQTVPVLCREDSWMKRWNVLKKLRRSSCPLCNCFGCDDLDDWELPQTDVPCSVSSTSAPSHRRLPAGGHATETWPLAHENWYMSHKWDMWTSLDMWVVGLKLGVQMCHFLIWWLKLFAQIILSVKGQAHKETQRFSVLIQSFPNCSLEQTFLIF